MSKRVRLSAEMGTQLVEVGWLEVTPTGMILEAYFFDPVSKLTAGEKPHKDTRCTWCALDACVVDLVSEGAVDCLCCKSNHGKMDPNKVREVTKE